MLENLSPIKIVKYLSLGLAAVSFALLLKEVILKPKQLTLPFLPSPSKKIEINLEFLEDQKLQNLLPFEEISLPEEIGRDNPFQPYLESESESE
ncbi:MAG: hypothetical protein DRH33_08955 [Candidatus Nealsonbacteria bacterium]|nr:MAG: hypothetical protein DRH33_08955 [Candidatus Nealsonbacteria bacterium]